VKATDIILNIAKCMPNLKVRSSFNTKYNINNDNTAQQKKMYA